MPRSARPPLGTSAAGRPADVVDLAERKRPRDLWRRILSMARALPRRDRTGRQAPQQYRGNPFAPAKPLPGVVGEGAKAEVPKIAMDAAEVFRGAMDDATGASVESWVGSYGAQYFYSAYLEGQEWLGYAVLALLAQRPEYRIITGTFATEMTREWIEFKSKSEDHDKQTKIDQLVKRLKDLKLRKVVKSAIENDGFQGRGQIYVDTGDEDDREELKTSIGSGDEVSRAKFGRDGDGKKKIKRLSAIEPMWCYPSQYNADDPLKVGWYSPETWWVMGKEVHRTRLLTFVSSPVPDMLKPAYSFGGLSRTQQNKPYVDFWLRNRTSGSDLLNNFSIPVLATDMNVSMMDEGNELFQRVQTFNVLRDNQNTMVINKDSEEFSVAAAPLGGVKDLVGQSAEHMTIPSRIPIVKFFGDQPSGLNSTSEGVIRMFYDEVHAEQENILREPIQTIVDLVQIEMWGEVDDDIGFEFLPLWQLDEAGKSAIQKTKADQRAVDIEAGLVSPEEARLVLARDPDSQYAGLDLRKPLPPPEEEPDLAGEEPDFGGEEGREQHPAARPSHRDLGGLTGQAARFGGAISGGFVADEWREGDHPRGQPGNAGQFGSGGTKLDLDNVKNVKILAREMGWYPSDREVRAFAEHHPDEAAKLLERGLDKQKSRKPAKVVPSAEINSYVKSLRGLNPSYRVEPLDADVLRREGSVELPPVVVHNTSTWNAGDLTSLQSRLGQSRAIKEFLRRWPDASREQAEVDVGLVWTSDGNDRGQGGINLAINAAKVPDLEWYIPENEPDGGFVARIIPKDAIIGVVGDPDVDKEVARLEKEYAGGATDEWREGDHPRGQPGNAGQFAAAATVASMSAASSESKLVKPKSLNLDIGGQPYTVEVAAGVPISVTEHVNVGGSEREDKLLWQKGSEPVSSTYERVIQSAREQLPSEFAAPRLPKVDADSVSGMTTGDISELKRQAREYLEDLYNRGDYNPESIKRAMSVLNLLKADEKRREEEKSLAFVQERRGQPAGWSNAVKQATLDWGTIRGMGSGGGKEELEPLWYTLPHGVQNIVDAARDGGYSDRTIASVFSALREQGHYGRSEGGKEESDLEKIASGKMGPAEQSLLRAIGEHQARKDGVGERTYYRKGSFSGQPVVSTTRLSSGPLMPLDAPGKFAAIGWDHKTDGKSLLADGYLPFGETYTQGYPEEDETLWVKVGE